MAQGRSSSDPLISHGRHFGRTVFALCNYPSLLTNGILRLEQMKEIPLEDFCTENGSEEEILHVGELISLKGAAIQPPLHRNSKINCGFNHKLTGSLLCPAGLDWHDAETRENLCSGEIMVCGDQWPVFLYANHTYDAEDLWCGLLRSRLLTSYIATQVRFALSSSSVFSQTNTSTDSEMFYHSLLDLFKDPDESKEVDELLMWWNCQVFPTSSAAKRPISANSALLKTQLKRLATKNTAALNVVAST
ncbi:uncharacterized protein F5147DRAFT_748483 [Suillus discolor]|uniref:Uncharacterized protein n=1 Tax=Suillus discolor TaxID=1912936 RepID=A0A9P7ETM9_9AGAM|nr:uncharacterized protein F5147DRAFT_748483 [Suillus discolor]KAG2088016.1 hypothetical protein F5147DRAFT_748483 [Suillus discolor]